MATVGEGMLRGLAGLGPLAAIYWTWAIWYAGWLLTLFWMGRTTEGVDWRTQGNYQLASTLGMLLLFVVPALPWNQPQLWPMSPSARWAMEALAVAAFLFCWWARITMGRLWSGFIALRADHRVIDSGPFAVVRHPIYAGIGLAALATAAAQATATGLGGAALIVLSFWLKARLEEGLLVKVLGEAYGAYRERVPMLVPFWPS